MPRKERKDFPDCCWDIFYSWIIGLRDIIYIYVQVDTTIDLRNLGCINSLVHIGT